MFIGNTCDDGRERGKEGGRGGGVRARLFGV